MESNDQLTKTDIVENQPEQSEQSKITTEIKSESEIKTEIIPIEWVVGYFENENLYSVIPSNWLLNINDAWYSKWPNSSNKAAVQTRIINAVEPAKTWKYYPVEVIKRYDSYLEAEQETFSCISVVDQDNLGRGKRKKKSNFRHYDLSGDSDSESSVSVKIKSKPKKLGRKSLNQDTNVASSSNSFEIHQESCSSRSSFTNVQNNGAIYEGSNSNSSNIFTRRQKKNLKKEDDKYLSLVFECIDRIDNNLNELGKVLIKQKVATITRETLRKSKQELSVKTKKEPSVKMKQDPLIKIKQPSVKIKQEPSVKIKQEPLVNVKQELLVDIKQEPIDDLDSFEEVEIELLDPEFLSNFPMTELDDIINLEVRLVNCPEFKDKFISYLTSIGGADIKSYVKRILSQSFTNRLATQCTWRGYHGNFELQRLHLIETMCDVSKSIFGDSIETAFEVYVKEWFRRGKQRYSRQLNTVRAKTAA